MSTAANTLAARNVQSAYVAATEGTASTGYASITTFGPWLSCVTGTQALVGISAQLNVTNNNAAYMSYEVSNATTIAASDSQSIMLDDASLGAAPLIGCIGAVFLCTGLTPGTNQFTCQYRVTSSTATWGLRNLWVMSL